MRRRFHILTFSMCGLLGSVLLSFSISSPSRFETFCDHFFQEEITANSLSLHYTVETPEDYHISDHTVTLGSFTADTSLQKRELLLKFFTLQTIARGQLSSEEQITYDLLQYSLRSELDRLDFTLLEEPLTPSVGIQSQLPILLAEYTFSTEADVINYLTLLSCLPEYFDSLLALEEQKCSNGLFMDAESAGELITYCEEFLEDPAEHFLCETFRERISSLAFTKEQQAFYIEKNEEALKNHVFPSYQKLQDFLTAHQNDGSNQNGLFYLPDGVEYYRWLLHSQVGTDRSFEEIDVLLDKALKQDASKIALLLKEDPSLLEQRQNISIDTSHPAGLTSYLSKRTAYDFPEIEDVSVEICSVPSSMEAHLSPAFYLVPPIDRPQHNIVYLNNGSLKEGISFFTTLAHESYPGHLYQTSFENSGDPHPIRRLLYFGGYIEGWATYAEQFSYSYAPISGELSALLACTRAMTLNLYSHLDLYVHAYGWTETDCADYLKKFGITGARSVHDMFLLVKQQPANYLKYYLGYLEICSLRETAEERMGEAFILKEFHEFVLDYGPAPFGLMKKYLEEWIYSSR